MIQAIETIYKGYRFRSRLEARWAVFFAALEIEWQYEPEGYVFDDGTRYLPDFLLPKEGLWIEVKGDAVSIIPGTHTELVSLDAEAQRKCELLYEATSIPVVIFSDVGCPVALLFNDRVHAEPAFYPTLHSWSTIRHLRDLEWLGAQKQALCAARQARFEHGESPRLPRLLR